VLARNRLEAMVSGPRVPSQLERRRGEAAAWGQRPHAAERPRMRLISWKPLIKNSLRGFSTVELPIGLKLVDCPVLVSNGATWASLPSKPVLVRRQARQAGRETATQRRHEWRSHDLADRFRQAIVGLVRERYPEALASREADEP
jgi:hypothetical protein